MDAFKSRSSGKRGLSRHAKERRALKNEKRSKALAPRKNGVAQRLSETAGCTAGLLFG
jgi:hypothetical protein